MSNIYNKRVPRLFDEAVGYLQQALQGDAMFSQYLDNIFGIAERTVKQIGGRNYFSPSWFVNGYDYINLLPDDKLGNYVFFTLDEPQEIEHEQGLQNRYTCGFNIILWAKFDSISDEVHQRVNLLLRAVPVLGRKGIDGQVFHACPFCGFDGVVQRIDASLVAFRTVHSTLPGPTSVTIHDDGH